MLKKKQWLRLLSELLSKHDRFDNYTIQEALKTADEAWKAHLSPGEAAIILIEYVEDFTAMLGIKKPDQPADPADPQPGQQFY